MKRILITVLTVALMGLVIPIGVSSSAQAAKPRRHISANPTTIRADIYIRGKITGQRTKAVVERRTGHRGSWKRFHAIRTNNKGAYRFRAPGPKKVGGTPRCYRIVVPANKRFRRTYQAKLTYPSSVKGDPICITKNGAGR